MALNTGKRSKLPIGQSPNPSPYARVNWRAVGQRIRNLRGSEITQEQFADGIRVSQNYLSTMERGKAEIGAEILLRISLKFDRSIEWLLTGNTVRWGR